MVEKNRCNAQIINTDKNTILRRQTTIRREEERTDNSRFAKAGVSSFYESEVLNSSFVHLMKFSAEKTAFAKRQKVMDKVKERM